MFGLETFLNKNIHYVCSRYDLSGFLQEKVTVARLYFHVGCHHDFDGQQEVVVHICLESFLACFTTCKNRLS